MNWRDLFSMEGHGAYVWGSVGMCVALMIAEVIWLRQRIRNVERRL